MKTFLTLISSCLVLSSTVLAQSPLAFTPPSESGQNLFELSESYETVIRGQSFDYGVPPAGAYSSGTYGSPTYNGGPNGFSNLFNPYGGATLGNDPFAPGYANPPVGGLNGAQPFRQGWTERLTFTWLDKSSVKAINGPTANNGVANGTDMGNLGVFEIDLAKSYTTFGAQGWAWTWAPEFNYVQFDGPGAPNIDSSLYAFSSKIQLNSPQSGPLSWQIGFTPRIATDFEKSLNSDAWQFDGELVAFYQSSPTWKWVLGATYWDRVDDIVLPYAGAVWTPNQYWEWRLIFPKPRVDVFLGTPWGHATWLYAGGEYNVESYQVLVDPTGTRPDGSAANVPGAYEDAIQIEDIRTYLGLRFDNGWLASFIEAGVSFDREFQFDNGSQDFEASSAFMLRAGFRY